MTDDIAGQYSDYQDRQEKSSLSIEETIECVLIEWLDMFLDKEFSVWYTRPQLRDEAQKLTKHLLYAGFEITIRKEVSP